MPVEEEALVPQHSGRPPPTEPSDWETALGPLPLEGGHGGLSDSSS